MLSGSRIDAHTAYAWGLAEEIVPVADLYNRAMALCRRLAAQPRLAMSMAKMLVNQATAGAIRNGFGQELIAQTALFTSPEHLEIKENAQRHRQAAGSRIDADGDGR